MARRSPAPQTPPTDDGERSPDQLDQLIGIARPRLWIALVAVFALLAALLAWSFVAQIPSDVEARGVVLFANGPHSIQTTMAGQVTRVLVANGQTVSTGQPLLDITTTAGNPATLTSDFPGRIAAIQAFPSQLVTPGETLFVLNPLDQRLTVFTYVPLTDGKILAPRLPVQVSPTTAPQAAFGFLHGTITSVSQYPVPASVVSARAGNPADRQLSDYLLAGGPKLEVEVRLQPDSSTASGYSWSSPDGRFVPLSSGTLVTTSVQFGHTNPIKQVVPGL